MPQRGHLERHGVAESTSPASSVIAVDSARLRGWVLPPSSWSFYLVFFFFFPLCYCSWVGRRYTGNCKASMNWDTKVHKNTAVTFIRRGMKCYHTFSRDAASWGHDMPLDSESCITGQHHKHQSSTAMWSFFFSPTATCLPLFDIQLSYSLLGTAVNMLSIHLIK